MTFALVRTGSLNTFYNAHEFLLVYEGEIFPAGERSGDTLLRVLLQHYMHASGVYLIHQVRVRSAVEVQAKSTGTLPKSTERRI